MIRLSVTALESYRYFKNAEDGDLDRLLADLAHVSPPTRKMAAGRALAKFFEHARDGAQDAAVVDGWRFDFNLDAAVALPALRELKVEEVFQTSSGPVTLVGKLDGIEGIDVHDQKLTDSLDVEGNYIDSLQWRAYLAMLGAKRFVYDIFVGRVSEREEVVTVSGYHRLVFYSYPNIRADVERAVGELAEVVTTYQPQIAALKGAA